MNAFDTVLTEKLYSPLAGWMQHQFGISQWRLSLECLNGSIAFYLGGLAFTLGAKGMTDGIFVDLLAAMVWLAVMEVIRHAARRQASSSLGVQTARMREWIFRLVALSILPFSIYYVRDWNNLCYTLSLVLLISHLYFKTCDIPPPQRRLHLAFSRG